MQQRMTYNTTPENRPDAVPPARRAIHRSSFIVHRSAFTLVELMVSIAMVVLLLFGIHQVFRMSSNTIGTGQAVNAMSRETRAAQTVMQEDFRRSLKDSPVFIISSQPAGARVDPSLPFSANPPFTSGPFHFLSRQDRERDNDGDPATIDRDGDGNEETTYTTRRSLAQVNDRIHRADILGFFARGLFTRQTANDGLYVSDTKAFDAWVWYGHTRLPDPIVGGYWDPGDVPPANPESPNQFAANWVLGRRAILFKDFSTINNEAFVGAGYAGGSTSRLAPLAWNSAFVNGSQGARATTEQFTGGGNTQAGGTGGRKPVSMLRDSRLDLAGMTVENYRANLFSVAQGYTGSDRWWHPLVFRYECDPRVRKPISSSNLAKTTPFFLGNVSQFLVEFAGDFLTQNNDVNDAGYGLVTGFEPDGVIDYVMLAPNVADQTDPLPYPANPRVRKTRWYGLPRDSNGDGKVTGAHTGGNTNAMPDVVPVAVVMSSAGFGGGKAFEYNVPDIRQGEDGYSNIPTPARFRYVCAWTDDAPAMVRVVMKIEDGGGRLPDGQWVEFVLDSP